MLNSFRKLKKDNNGAAMVMVIIALAFVGILAVTIMWMSLANFRMKATEQGIKTSFYTAETVFEQIVAGLQGEASDAAAEAYQNVLQNYAGMGSDEERKAKFIEAYKDELVKRIKPAGGSPNQYDTTKISAYLDPVLQARLGTDGNSFIMSGVLERSADSYDFVTLKGFELKFTDDRGYYSVINTDIMINAPRVSFTRSSAMPDIFKYAIIADDQLVKSSTDTVTIKGSVYAGEKGISVTNGTLDVDIADYLISMGPVDVQGPVGKLKVGNSEISDDDGNTQFWAQDIKLSGTPTVTGGNIDIYANTYVADDLTIENRGSAVKLRGKYIGYGDNASTSDKSSAIMINNINSDINMSSLEELTLAGYSFVDLSSYYKDDATQRLYRDLGGGNHVSSNDIPMYESIAVKSDQIAMLIPESCIYVVGADRTNTKLSQNPLVWNTPEYISLLREYCGYDGPDNPSADNSSYLAAVSKIGSGSGSEGYKLYEVMLNKDMGNGKSLSNYGVTESDVTRAISNIEGGNLIYYYMKMTPENATQYIHDYYADNPGKMKEYLDVFSHVLDLPESGMKMKGSFLAKSVNGTAVSENSIMNANNINVSDQETLNAQITAYKAIISSLTERLVEGGYANNTVDTDSPESHVFKNIVDRDRVVSFLSLGGGERRFTTPDGYYALVTNGDYTYSDGSDKCRLIISLGNVEIKKKFTGVIFAEGTINISDGCNNIESVEIATDRRSELVRVLQQDFSDTDSTKPIDLLIDGSSYVLAGTEIEERDDPGAMTGSVDILSTVNYKNWIKK